MRRKCHDLPTFVENLSKEPTGLSVPNLLFAGKRVTQSTTCALSRQVSGFGRTDAVQVRERHRRHSTRIQGGILCGEEHFSR